MKIKRFANLRPVALVALGVFLGRGAHADTVVDFDGITGQNNNPIDQSFGDYALASSVGVTVTGFGTPNIGVTWAGFGDPATEWEYYNDSVWSAGQLNHSIVGSGNDVIFTPNNASASVVVKSFNFHPYYDFATYNERFTFDVRVLSGTNVLSGPIHITFQSDGTKAHPVNVNYTGAPGQKLTLRMSRVASVLGAGEVEGFPGDIAVDDITFAQLPASTQPIGPQVVSISPFDDQTLGATAYSFLASITNGDSTLVSSSIKLKLDGTLVSPTITSSGGLTNVQYTATNLLSSGSTHFYTLSYADNLSANYTNDTVFYAATYPTLPPAYANLPGSGVIRGFTWRTVLATVDPTNAPLDSTVARAKAQLAGTLFNPSTGMPYTNDAPNIGTNADGSFNLDTVINFDDDGMDSGNFTNDVEFPGLEGGFGGYNWFSAEGLLYLDLQPGYYRLGVNSDDGFEFNALPPQGVSGSPIQLGIFDNGRSASDTVFDFLVQANGVYCFQLIYFESTGSASCELFSVNIATGVKTLINDPTNVNAIKSYRVLRPHITSIARAGSNAAIQWAYGAPPFQVQFTPNITNTAWSDVGAPTTNRTANVPIQPGNGFIRVYGK